jgi:N-methylhydantoinase A
VPADVAAVFDEMEGAAAAQFAADGIAAERVRFQRFADARYWRQEHTVKIEFPAGDIDEKAIAETIGRFHDGHEREYTFRLDKDVEIVNYHLAATGDVAKPELARLAPAGRKLEDAARGTRDVDFDDKGVHATAIYDRELLDPGVQMVGPVVVEEPAATLLVPPGHAVRVDDYGNLVVEVGT